MNGNVRTTVKIPADFEPSSRLNEPGSQIAITTIAPGTEVITYSAAEARRYAAAFTRAAGLLAAAVPLIPGNIPFGTESDPEQSPGGCS